MVDLEPLNVLSILLLAWAALYLLSMKLPFKKLGLEITPLYLTYRTGRLNGFLKKTATRNPRFWKIASNIGVAVAVGEIALAFYFLGNNLLNFL